MATPEEALAAVEPAAKFVRAWAMSGGISAQMTGVDGVWPDGSTRRIVVREPFESGRAVGVREEAALLSRLATLGLPVPHVLHVGADEPEWIAPAYVDGAPAVSPADPVKAATDFADVLARIHATDISAPELANLPPRTPAVAGWLERPPPVLDESLQEGLVRDTLRAHWPPSPPPASCLLHGDFWPGNVIVRDGVIVVVIDWEEASLGDPIADVAISRLDILWAYGREASDAFTARYVEVTRVDVEALPLWDLVASLRPAGYLAMWAEGWPDLGRPDITADTMRSDHQWFTARALASVRP